MPQRPTFRKFLPSFIVYFLLSFIFTSTVLAQKGDSALLFSRLAAGGKKEQLRILEQIYSELYKLQPEKFIRYSRQTVLLARELNDPAAEAKACFSIAYYYRLRNMTDSALHYNQLGFDIARNLNDNALIARAYGNRGNIYLYGGQKVKALENLTKALTIDSADENVTASICFGLGLVYSDAGRTDKSVYYYLKALKIREKRQEWIEAAYIYCNIAGFYFESFGFREGIKTYDKALELFVKGKFSPGIAYVCNNMGMAYAGNNMPDSALRYFRKSMAINEKDTLGTRSAYVFNLGNIGDTWMQQGRLDSAGYYYLKGKSIAEKGGDGIAISTIYFSLGELLVRQKKYPEAIAMINSSLGQTARMKIPGPFDRAYTLLAECYEATGNKEAALRCLRKRDAIKDSLMSEKAREDVARMMIRYETSKKEQQIIDLQIEAKQKQRQIRNAMVLIAGLLIVILLASWLSWRYYRRRIGPKVKAMSFIEEKLTEEMEGDSRKLRALEKVLPPDMMTRNDGSDPDPEIDPAMVAELEKLMNDRKAYLDENLTLAEAARLLNTNTTYLSRLINSHYQVNFSTFVNRHRIEEAQRMILDKQFDHLSLEGIAKNAGFRSKSTFNQVFKQTTGMTPTEYSRKGEKGRK